MDGGIEGLMDGWKAVLVLGCLSSSIFMTVSILVGHRSWICSGSDSRIKQTC